MTSAKLRGWGSYFSKKVDDAFSSLIPTPPQSNQQDADRLEANPQEGDRLEANPQEADPPYQQELNRIREFREAIQGGDEALAAYQHRRNQEAQRRVRRLRLCTYILWVWVFIIWVAVISFIIIRYT